ncbi:MAG: hypothetical protein KJ017_12315 [Alphaproteobacteria bacterium]|nr:hypothetical protein [Alphaproteobacteria bacterium]
MDEIQKRLQETAETCIKTYEEWRTRKTDTKAQESLHSAIHELRKVASRLEIELAVRERQDVTSKPIPIPSHRSSTKDSQPDSDDDQQDFHGPSSQGGHRDGQRDGQGGPRRRRPPPRSAEHNANS